MARLRFILVAWLVVHVMPAAAQKVDPVILARGEATMPVFVEMKTQLFGEGGWDAFVEQNQGQPRSEIRKTSIGTLKENAARSWDQVKRQVDELGFRVIERYWVVNGFLALANKQACEKLAQSPHVQYVYQYRGGGLSTASRDASETEQALTKVALEIVDARQEDVFESDFDVTWNVEKVKALQAWKAHGVLGEGVTVAINDGGIAVAKELCESLWRNDRESINGQDDDGNGYVDDLFGYDFRVGCGFVLHPHPHGTACAGIVAARPSATDSPKTVVGIAPRARVMPLIGGLNLKLYQYALDQGADIMSMSFMMPSQRLGPFRGVVRRMHEHAAAAGMLCVGGAGNFGSGSRRAWPKGMQIGTPKDIPCVIAVAGILPNGKRSPLSSEGPCFWQDIPFYSDYDEDRPLQKPDLTGCFGGYPVWYVLPPKQSPQRLRVFRRVEDVSQDNQKAQVVIASGPQGNSFSGPHAAGVAALVLSANPELNPWEVKSILESTAVDMGDNGWDKQFGHGLLDAKAAVASALSTLK